METRLALVVIATTLALTPVSVVAAQNTDPGAAIDAYVRSLARQGHFSGRVLVARGANVIVEKAYGSASHRAGTANTTGTLFAIASLTKPMTGIAARTLAQRGAIDLDSPIATWLPDFPNGARITVAHLLGHRSGLPHRVTTLADEQAPQTAESMIRLASRATPAFEPNARRLYSSYGYSVLSRVLELASGKPYAQLLRELVLDPAGAKTAIDATDPRLATAERAIGHFWTPSGPIPAVDKQLSFLVGAGSLWATPRDVFAVARRVIEGGFSGADGGARPVQWTGFSNGFFASIFHHPTTDVTVVLTSNLLTGAVDWIARDVPRILAGEQIPEPRAPQTAVVALAERRRAELAGLYDYFGNRQQLAFVTPSVAILGGEYLLVATGDTSFFAPQNYAEFAVVSDSAGVVALRMQGDNGFSMTKVR